MTRIRVVDFFRSPGGRFASQGPNSGEQFRETVLRPALREAVSHGDTLVVELDGTSGYGSSFLEEAFGGLVRSREFLPDILKKHLQVTARTDLFRPYELLAHRYIDAAARTPTESA